MKKFLFYSAIILPMLLLVSCQSNNPDAIKEDSTNMLTLAESLLGQKESGAVAILSENKMTQDPDSLDTYVKDSRLTAYIRLGVEADVVEAVELGKDHKTKEAAMVTEKVWSRYTEDEAVKDCVLWTATIICGADTTLYMDGSLKETLQSLITTFGSFISEDTRTELEEAMKRDSKTFQLDLADADPQTITSIEEVAYHTDFDLSGLKLLQALINGIDVESATCQWEEVVEAKNTYYRIIYTHALNETLKLSDLF